jgi:hypothetical protein
VRDFLESKQREIDSRIAELKPQVDEYQRLQAASAALARVSPATTNHGKTTAAKPTSRPGRPRKPRPTSKPSASAPTTRRGAGRPKGSGARASQAVTLITGQPGITILELAAKMGIKQNYLYRVLPPLQQEGKITKQGRGWHPIT